MQYLGSILIVAPSHHITCKVIQLYFSIIQQKCLCVCAFGGGDLSYLVSDMARPLLLNEQDIKKVKEQVSMSKGLLSKQNKLSMAFQAISCFMVR